MVSLLFMLFLYLVIICYIFHLVLLGIIFGVFDFLFFLVFIACVVEFSSLYAIEKSMILCQQENINIEGRICKIIKNHMDFKKIDYKEFKDEDFITLISLFPELESNTFVSQQIKIYVANTKKIKDYKEHMPELLELKWMLYFNLDFRKFGR